MSGETVPHGWKVLPGEPTWETLIAGRDALMDTDDEIDISTDQIRECYRAMFSISPAPAAAEAEKPNFCESCAGPLATCDCVTPRPTIVVYGSPAPMTDAARAEYWKGVAERALSRQGEMAWTHGLAIEALVDALEPFSIAADMLCGVGHDDTSLADVDGAIGGITLDYGHLRKARAARNAATPTS